MSTTDSAMRTIDLNADLGEGGDADTELLEIVTSCNIACGGHAGDAKSMHETLVTAAANRVAIGAHPSYPDKQGFGRRSHFMTGADLRVSLGEQIEALRAAAESIDAVLSHIKPHGALYNDAIRDRDIADVIVGAVAESLPDAAIVGFPNSELQTAARERGMAFVTEGFVDRAYADDGLLVSRSEPGAVYDDPDMIAAQAVSLLGRVDTLCIHGDTPGAVAAAITVRDCLLNEEVKIAAVCRR